MTACVDMHRGSEVRRCTEVQVVSTTRVPDREQLVTWVDAALSEAGRSDAELTLRIVDETEGAELNVRYRAKEGPTNVLSFPFEDPPGVDTGILGDVVVCAPVVMREAGRDAVALHGHWAHTVIHGVLHLCGFDHETEEDAAVMQGLETRILAGFGFVNPYR